MQNPASFNVRKVKQLEIIFLITYPRLPASKPSVEVFFCYETASGTLLYLAIYASAFFFFPTLPFVGVFSLSNPTFIMQTNSNEPYPLAHMEQSPEQTFGIETSAMPEGNVSICTNSAICAHPFLWTQALMLMGM